MSHCIRIKRNSAGEFECFQIIPMNAPEGAEIVPLEFADIEKAVQALSTLNGANNMPSVESTAERVMASMIANPTITSGISSLRGEHLQQALAEVSVEIAIKLHNEVEAGRNKAREERDKGAH